MTGETLFCEPLDPDERERLRKRLLAYRAAHLSSLFGALQEDATSERLGSCAPSVQRFMAELSVLSATDPGAFERLIHHWAPTFLLRRLLYGVGLSPTQQQMVASNLEGALLFDRLARPSPGREAARYATVTDDRGRVCSLTHDFWVRLEPGHNARTSVVWYVESDRVTVQGPATNGTRPAVDLPWTASDPPVDVVPFPLAAGWGLPIIDDSDVLGVGSVSPADLELGQRDEPSWRPRPLSETLEGAHRLLADLWPEVIDWTHVLVPAFVDMGTPSPEVHHSSTHGAGSPVFLTRVSDPLLHAEDIVHELQHERFHLLLDPTRFASSQDSAASYVSPYRTDPRPLRGLHVALHAFTAVNEFRLRLCAQGADDRRLLQQMLRSHRMNLFAFQTISDYEQFDAEGRRYWVDVAAALAHQHELIEPRAGPEMSRHVDDLIEAHAREVSTSADGLRNVSARYLAWADIAAHAAETGSS
ncbi:MAG: HEXXH motif-containing putative peptide modification protein [Actinomycetota bacterium]|nr:HEXXH motif-containing putative peptide modification protein [Actinomycetota bacterium]